MKKVLLVACLGLACALPAAQAFEVHGPQSGLLEPVTFMRCKMARLVPDAGLNVVLTRERVGAEREATVTRFFLGRASHLVFPNLQSRPELVEGDEAVGTIYEASRDGHALQLAVHFAQGDGNGVSPSDLVVDGSHYDMLCQVYMTVN